MPNMYDINIPRYNTLYTYRYTLVHNIIKLSIWNLFFFPVCVYVLYCINNFENKHSTPKTNAYIDN